MSGKIFGFINAFKPPGPSSAAFGSWVKWRLGATAVGHWGTLDPTACGVLVLAVGKATKLLPLLTDDRKRYVFELVVGSSTDSGDATGVVIERAIVPADWQASLSGVILSLVGSLEQVPPMHSARKVDGRPLYASARKGEQVARAARTVTIYDLRTIESEAARARLDVTCSAGTYIRTLCEEIGRRSGLPAHMGGLIRVAAGPFALRDALRPDQIDAQQSACVIDPATVLDYERLELDGSGARRFLDGGEVRMERGGDGVAAATSRGTVLVTHAGALIGYGSLAQHHDIAVLAPVHVFAAAGEGNGEAAENG